MAEPLLQLKDVRAGYDRRDVLSGVNLEVPAGAVTALIGENGSGKTTLLRVVLGLLRPHAGELIHARGRPPRAGYVPQVDVSEVLFPVSALDVVLMGLTPELGLLRRPGEAQKLASQRAMERLGVAHLANTQFRTLSGGQRQRVLLARGIAGDPELLVLDEPVRGLDFGSSNALVAQLRALAREQHMAVLVATHSLDLVANHADHVALFSEGRVRSGPASELMTDAVLSAHHGVPTSVRLIDGQRVVIPGADA